MIIVMRPGAERAQVDSVIERIDELGCKAHPIYGVEHTVIGVIGDSTREHLETFEMMDGVLRVVPILQPYKLAALEARGKTSPVRAAGVVFGGETVPVIAGPCAVESEEQIVSLARRLKAAGADMLRGGAFKPRTSPYSFRGHEQKALDWLRTAKAESGLPVVTEVMSLQHVDQVAETADVLQIGARNMQNFFLLEEVGRTRKPVLLKRGLSSTVEELLMAAEYICSQGNDSVLLCERGIRTFETATRNTMDVSAIPVLHRMSHLPVVADPSHGTGHWWLVEPLAKACLAAGADGLMIEVHPNPATALSDGPQSLKPANFEKLVADLRAVAEAVGRRLQSAGPPGGAR
jgi:3-deoxy-7-phosphoheptulonate synthase